MPYPQKHAPLGWLPHEPINSAMRPIVNRMLFFMYRHLAFELDTELPGPTPGFEESRNGNQTGEPVILSLVFRNVDLLIRASCSSISGDSASGALAYPEVKGDLIRTPNVPAMAAPGDEFTVSVGVFNNSACNDPIHERLEVSEEPALASQAAFDLGVTDKREGVDGFRPQVQLRALRRLRHPHRPRPFQNRQHDSP